MHPDKKKVQKKYQELMDKLKHKKEATEGRSGGRYPRRSTDRLSKQPKIKLRKLKP